MAASWATLALVAACCLRCSIQRCPHRLLDVGPLKDGEELEGLRLISSGLESLSQQESPLYLVPMLGVYRGGKSLLLNRLMNKSAPYNEGFGVGHEQQTFTRGIQFCPEVVEDLGTVVWLDTEGLWSAEDSRSDYGQKIFSLVLLFASVVMLNSAKVLEDRFFRFFGEQQQIARVLKQGLASMNLPQETVLPGNLSVFWILSQPVNYDGNSEDGVAARQLEHFLNQNQDETRALVRRDFHHLLQEVPVAHDDYRVWRNLDKIPDSKLNADYVGAGQRLRERVLNELRRNARPHFASSVAKQLDMFVKLVQTEEFSGSDAKAAFEASEISKLCNNFSRKAAELAGPLPSTSLAEAFANASEVLIEPRKKVVEDFHLGKEWDRKLEACLKDQRGDMERRNIKTVLKRWEATVGQVAEEGDCFFMRNLSLQLREYTSTYGIAFNSDAQAKAIDYAYALQRTRLIGCLRLRDLLLPFAPWLTWPIFYFYLKFNIGFMNFGILAVVLTGVSVILKQFGALPDFANIDYKILQKHPRLLNFVMTLPPWVPWQTMGHICFMSGAALSLWKLVKYARADDGQRDKQLVILENKLNILLKRSEVSIKHSLTTSALKAAERLESSDVRGTAFALVQGLSIIRDEFDGMDGQLKAVADSQMKRKVRGLLSAFCIPHRKEPSRSLVEQCAKHKLVECVANADYEQLVKEMFRLLKVLNEHATKELGSPTPTCSITPPSQRSGRPSELETGELHPRDLDLSLGDVASSDASSPPSFGSPGVLSQATPQKEPFPRMSSPGPRAVRNDPKKPVEDQLSPRRPSLMETSGRDGEDGEDKSSPVKSEASSFLAEGEYELVEDGDKESRVFGFIGTKSYLCMGAICTCVTAFLLSSQLDGPRQSA